MNRAVFLDRDNTLIPNDGDLGDPAAVKLMQGAAAGVASLRGLGYKIVVVTNQGGVARGRYAEADVQAVHERLSELLRTQANGAVVDAYYFCPYHPQGTVPRYKQEHPWRKPQPGMLLQAARDLKLDLAMCWMVGDAPRDIEAGKAAATRTVLIRKPDAQGEQLTLDPSQRPDFEAQNLVEAARLIAQHLKPQTAIEAHMAPTGSKTTYPAVQPLGASRSSVTRDPIAPRPFKPWDIQPRTDADNSAGEPASSTQRMTRARGDKAEQRGSEAQPKPEPEVIAAPPTPPAPAQPAAAAVPPPPSRSPATVPPAASRQPAEPTDDALPEDRSTANVLRQILRELRQRHAQDADWSLTKMLGLGLAQPLAGFCALMGILNVNDPAQLQAWLTGGVLCQLLVVTLLLIHWQR